VCLDANSFQCPKRKHPHDLLVPAKRSQKYDSQATALVTIEQLTSRAPLLASEPLSDAKLAPGRNPSRPPLRAAFGGA
jgi:hypothetical protein